MNSMFYNCNSLLSIDISSFNTKNVIDISYMFYNCSFLLSINLSKFDTNSINNMENLFYNCHSLKTINILNFKTENVTKMNEMFYNCTSLKYLNLSYFNTKNVIDMSFMFYNCNSLLSINLSNFDTSNVINMSSMFSFCNSLLSIDLSFFNTSSLINIKKMFYNSENLNYIVFYDLELDKNNINHDNFLDGTPENLVYCIHNISSLKNINELILDKKECPILDCSNNWRTMQKKLINERIECRDNCWNDETNKYMFENICYKDKCPYDTHSLLSLKYYCEKDYLSCPENKPYELIRNKECITDCSINDFFNGICRPNTNYIKAKDDIINNIIKRIESDKSDVFISTIKYEKKDLIVRNDDISYQITSFENQKNNKYDDISTIDFGISCEKILKEKYNIPSNETIIFIKMEYTFNEFYIPIIEYQLFHPISKIKLDLSYCIKNDINNVNYSIPVFINENNLFMHDPNDAYYTDICYINNNTELDLTLYDKKKEFNNKSLSLCEKNCVFKGYDKNTKKVLCECKTKTKFNLFSEQINLAKDEFLNNFIKIEEIINLVVLKCYKILFNKDSLINNIGSYTILSIGFIYIIGLIFFLIKGYPYLYSQIKEIMNYKKEIIDKKNLVNTFDDKVNNKRKAKDIIKNEILDINIIFHNKHKQEKKGLELNKTNLNVNNLTPTTELNSNIKFNKKNMQIY